VTFHARIKSSGYGQKPMDAFAKKRLEQTNKQKRSISAPRGQPATRTPSAGSGEIGSTAGRRPLVSSAANLKTGVRTRQYPVDCEPMSLHQAQNDFLCRSPIHNIVFSEDASLLGIAANDAAVLAVRLPVAKNNREAISYMGHNGRVNGISFSHTKPNNQQMLLSCSVDGTARVWKGGRVDSAAVLFSHTRHQPGDIIPLVSAASIATGGMGAVAASLKATASLGAKPSTMSTINSLTGGKQPVASSSTRNRPFGSDVTSAQFYYMDKFALLVSFVRFGE
jgi:WD40 repeat protein